MSVIETLAEIREALNNPEDEADRMGAWGALQMYLDDNPADTEAIELYDSIYVLRWNGQGTVSS